ncbi:ArsR/SmtB family transcription factor [Pilimelia anulata]|uniref:ArsR/SmtB family transcription factor n=1 Tax=Pilimelia anulata TaxID=53371 RepID=UPI0035711A83
MATYRGPGARRVGPRSPAGTHHTVLEALADPTRRDVLAALRAGPASVGELARRLPVSRPAVSQHLRVLRDSGLVRYEPAGTRNVYRLDPTGLGPLHSWLDGFRCTPSAREGTST